MSTNQNNAKIVSTCSQRITALNKLVDTKTPMKINGQLMTLAEVLAVYQTSIDTRSELISKRAAFDKALDSRDNAESTRRATDKGLNAWVTSEFGTGSQEAQELGFLPRKIGSMSAATKALAVVKTLATREARRTMGKRQKKDIKGTIEVPTEPAAPAITAPAAAPAANAPSVVNGTTNGALNGASSANGAAATH